MDDLAVRNQEIANHRLWIAVIENAIAEWERGPFRYKVKAEHFLFRDEDDFPFVCRCAGLSPMSVRETLWAIRTQTSSAPNTKGRTPKLDKSTSPLNGVQPEGIALTPRRSQAPPIDSAASNTRDRAS